MIKRLFYQSEKAQDVGLLIIRVGIGLLTVAHGYPKIAGGINSWLWLGSQMRHVGITFAPAFFGCFAACTEFFGGLGLVLGLCTRIAGFFLSCVMFVAVAMHLSLGDGFQEYSHALSLLVLFVGLTIAGAGRLSLDWKLTQ